MAFSQTYPFRFLLFLLLLSISSSTNAQTYKNVSLGLSLTAQNGNSPWLSPSGDFAFGFQQITSDGFLLAIWFNKIPERTIVWSANRNNLVPKGSKVALTRDGELVLNDPSGNIIWNPPLGGTGVSHGAMLDTGNLVLASQDSVNLWESFNEPTDTMLPTQTLNQGAELIARYADRNYSNGRFKFTLETSGNLILYTTRYPQDTNNFDYWDTQTSIGFQVIYNQSGNVYLIARNGSLLKPVFSDQASVQDFYQRATIDSDGVFRQYVYPKSTASTSRWPPSWSTLSSIPSNICLKIRGDTGSGACGYNSYCSFDDETNPRPSCLCPPGYDLLDPNDVSKGCKENFAPQICDGTSQETNLFTFRDMPNTDWPTSDYEYFSPVAEDWCRQVCLSDCRCAVAIYRDQNCWKKKIPLSNGRTDPTVGGKALIKVRRDNSTANESVCSKKKDKQTLIGGLILGSSVFLNVLLLLATFVYFLRRNHKKPKMIQPHQGMPAMSPRCYTYNELEAATGRFKEELGSGAFGTVYKGVLENREVAVKRLNKMLKEGEQEFKTEVSVIGGTNHKNLVKLVGFCNEGEHRLLVYEYMANGSLANYIFGDSRPYWHERMQIAFGVARGLSYLHEDCSSQIIHCDIKPQNILIDESMKARISDFGLAKLLETGQTRTTTAIRGTKGYVAPEWFRNMPITVKVDVYSFGILLLELICCRRNVELDSKDENPAVLADWAYDCHQERNLRLLVEDDEEALHDMKKVEKYVMIAIWCIQEDPSLRPSMKKVVHMLEGSVPVPVPPDPESFISTATI